MLEKNLNILKKKNHELFNLISKAEPSGKLEILKSRDGNYTAKLENKQIHSVYKPISEAKKLMKSLDLENKDIIVQLGFGLGYYTKELLSVVGKKTKLFIIEDNLELLKRAFEIFDFSNILLNEDVFFYYSYL